MDILVTTSQGLERITKYSRQRLLSGNGIYYGLTWDGSSIYVAERMHFGPEENLHERIAVYSPGFDLQHVIRTPFRLHDLHALFYHPDEENLYAANAGKNQILVWNRGKSGGEHPTGVLPWEVLTSQESKPQNRDINHVNSVWWDTKNQRMYIVEHNRGESRVVVTDQTYKPIDIMHLGREAHDAVLVDRRVLTCSSREGALIEYDPLTRRKTRMVKFGGSYYPRGLAVTEDRIYVGLTAFNPQRGIRNTGTAKVLVLNRDMETVRSIRIPGAGQVLAIRAARGDLAHNGLDFPEE